MKSNKFRNKINFLQKFRKYTIFFPNYDLAKLKQIRTMKVCNKIKIIIFDKINFKKSSEKETMYKEENSCALNIL